MTRSELEKEYLETYIREVFNAHDYEKYEQALSEYLVANPYSVYYKILYSEVLISKKMYEEASMLLNEITLKPDTHLSLMFKYYKAMVATSIGLGYYELALNILNEKEKLFKAFIYEYDEIIMYINMCLGKYVSLPDRPTYDMKQIYDYKYQEFVSNVVGLDNFRKKLLRSNKPVKDVNTAVFNTKIMTIQNLASEVNRILKVNDLSDYVLGTGTIFDEYYFECPGIAEYKGNNCDYIKAIAIRDTKKITSIQPAPFKGTHKSIKLR